MSEADRRQVEAMAAYGIPDKEIARVIGIDQDELRGRYPDELDTGSTRANSRVAENLYRRATGESREAVTAAIFWLKTRAGWRETSAHIVEGSSTVRYVARLPEPIASSEEWFDRYALPAAEEDT